MSRGGRKITVGGTTYKSVTAAARAYGLDYRVVSARLAAGWPVERAFVKGDQKSIPVTIGRKTYPSIAAAADALGITQSKANHLREQGRALDTKTQHRGVTFKGVKYSTTREACAAAGVPGHIYQQRRRAGMTLEQALAKPHKKPVRIVVDGVGYPSVQSAAKAFGISSGAVRDRLSQGMSPDEAFKKPVTGNGKQVEAFGVTYKSISQAAKAHGVDHGRVQARLSLGWSLENALKIKTGATRNIVIGGKTYATASDACREHGVRPRIYVGRIHCGWTPEQALGLTPRYGEWCLGMIYLATQRSTGKKYVGQTMRGSVELRWEQHVADSKAGGRSLIQKAIRSTGEEDFTIVELSRHQSRDELNAAEADAIEKHGTLAPVGFNKTAGGSGWVGTGKAITWKGKKYKSMARLARATGVPEFLLRDRLKKGWSLKRAITTPKVTVNAASRPVTFGGVRYESMNHACRAYGIASNVVRVRIDNGWSLKRALTTPVAACGGRTIKIEGVEYASEAAVARAYGVDQKVLWHRLNKMRLTPEQAVGLEEWPANFRAKPVLVPRKPPVSKASKQRSKRHGSPKTKS
jgi:hypothetical protein